MTKTHSTSLKVSFLLACFTLPLFLFSQTVQPFPEIPASLSASSTINSRPNYIKLQEGVKIGQQDLLNMVGEGRLGQIGSVFNLERSEERINNKTRHVYEQSYLGIPVYNHHWVLHEKDGFVVLAQGQFIPTNNNQDATPVLNEDQARALALENVNATEYAWEIPALEQTLQEVLGDPNATYYPSGELVWLAPEPGEGLQLVYRFDIYSLDPAERKNYFISAKTGHLVKTIDLINVGCFAHKHAAHTSCNETSHKAANFSAAGTGIARYIDFNQGIVDVSTGFDGTDYSLDYTSPEINIHTQSANNQWNYSNLTDYFDADNFWDTIPTAISAHWGAEQVYKYFLQVHGRNSFDGAGSPIVNIVHYGQDYPNAFWDGEKMTYGDGDGNKFGSFTSLDIIGHEIAHGVTETSVFNGLTYLDESGALNESFSDIFGSVIEFYVLDTLNAPEGGNWMVGEDFDLADGMGLRNMADPHALEHPKAYLGQYWYDVVGDNGGVHTNSSVQNHWFYLLCEGGSGTNEFGYDYNIAPIGIEKAAKIVYHNLTTYITSNSTYLDAKDGSLEAVLDLYPDDTSIYNAVEEAWCAVGLGTGCGPSIEINSPVLSETVTSGSTYEVVWNSPLVTPTSKVKIEYTTEEGNHPIWNFIADNVANTGTYDWSVPSDYSGTVRIRVTDDGDPSIGRIRNSDLLGLSEIFTIAPCISTASFESPGIINAGEAANFIGMVDGSGYQWEIDGQVFDNNKDFNYTFSTPGIYEITYTLTNTTGDCFNEETQRLYVVDENSNGFSVQVAGPNVFGGRAYAQEIIETSDGGFIFISLFTAMVFKVDAMGNEVWSSAGLPSPNYPNYRLTATEKNDGNILVVMGRAESGDSEDNLLLIELDGTNGSIINSAGKQISANGKLMPYKIIATDSSYIIGGGYQNGTEKDIFLVQLKASDLSIQNQLWVGDDNRDDFFGDIITTDANGGFMLGWIQSGTSPQHFALMKLDENLQMEWKQGIGNYKFFPGSRSRIQLKEIPDCEGYIILADGDEYANSALLKVNVLGNISWVKRYNTPDALNGQLISFQDMVGDGNNGVTMLGINATTLNSNAYPESVDYQLINVDYNGQLNWKRKVTDLDVVLPSFPSYNLIVTKILLAADGGYLAAIPGGDGGETHLIKTDSMGIDCCVMANTNILEEDITSSFYVDLNINTTLSTPPIMASEADYSFNISAPITTVFPPKCAIDKDSLIAAFKIANRTISVDSSLVLTNISRNAVNYNWRINDSLVNFPLPPFTSTGVYKITLEAADFTNSSFTSTVIEVVDDNTCELPCDLVMDQARPIDASCPNTDDGELYAEVSSAIGRTFRFDLYDDIGNFISTQNTGHFRNLATGDYQMIAVSDNDETCSLDLGILQLIPKPDTNPPQVYCQNATVDVAFVHAAVGLPWSHPNYTIEMNAAFGEDWHELIYEEVDASKLFSDSYNYIYLEGTNNNADEMETFLTANQQLMEDWVAAGNSLFLNAGPNEGDGMSFGFGGVNLVRGTYDSAFAVTPAFPIFTGPRTPTLTTLGDVPYSLGAVIIPANMDTTRVLAASNGTDLLVAANWGDGQVIFGGMNLTGFGSPSAAKSNVKINIHHYLSNEAIPTVNSPVGITLNSDHQFILTISDLSLGTFDDCGLQSVAIDNSNFNCMDIGLQTVNLIATDEAGNQGICTTTVDVLPLENTELNANICQGDTYLFDGQDLTDSGVYLDTLINTLGCDSIIVLHLMVTDTTQTQLIESICQGDFFTFNEQDLTTSGTYRDTLQNQAQCDSIIILDLIVHDTTQTQLIESICQGDFFTFNEQDLTTSGIYLDTLSNAAQCDSFIVLNLTVNFTSETLLTDTICQGEDYTFNGLTLDTSGIYYDTLINAVNCDSIIILELIVNNTPETLLAETICQGDTYTFKGQDLVATGIYFDTLQTVEQCDSFVTLELTVTGQIETQITEIICEGEDFSFGTQILTSSGIYRDTLSSIALCDSIIILDLTVKDTSQTLLSEIICQGDFFTFNGQDLTIAGSYRDTLVNEVQCDSFIILDLLVNNTSETLLTDTICEDASYTFNGQVLSTSGIYRDTMLNAVQCDSIIILDLTINSISETQLTETICQGEIYTFNGKDLNIAGIYRDTLVNEVQCDSFIILDLIVNDTIQTVLFESICEGDTYLFNDELLSVAGQYRDTLTTTTQCDSFLVLNLSVTTCTTTDCGEPILFLNNTPIQPGIYKAEIAIISGGVLAEDTITYQAGESILLEPGFSAPLGSEFLAFIDPTTCDSPGSLTEETPTNYQLKQSNPVTDFGKNTLNVSPNPFLNKTKIEFSLATPQQVRLAVYSMEGKLIQELTEGNKSVGKHTQYFEANGHYKGLYLVILQTEKEVLTQKIISLD